MSQVEFICNDQITIIQCNENEKMKDIIKKYAIKTQQNLDKVIFLYGGNQTNIDFLELTFDEVASSEDKIRKKMSILVNKEEENEDFTNLQKSKNIICPECKENIRMNMKNYKISLFDCKNKHRKDNILLNQFESTQYIDESKIICEKCKTNKSLTFENNFFICITCKIYICPLCKTKHDKEHDIIDYALKNYICFCHNENYNSYCNVCKQDICLYCEKDHANHTLISFGGIIPDKKDLNEKLNTFRNKINEFKDDIKEIMTTLNNLMDNLDIYFDIYEKMINNFEKKQKLSNITKY